MGSDASISEEPIGRAPHSRLGKYRLLASLGEGGMAIVYLAVAQGRAGFQKLVVLKVLRPALAKDEELVALFLQEARIAAQLGHPNIVQAYEVGEDDGYFYLAMEYLEGQPLSEIVRTTGARERMPLPLHVRVLSDALVGLQYAHDLVDFRGQSMHLVHRDISPDNLFVTYGGHTKLLDFGIAKLASSAVQTQTGVLRGKLAYMAPEQVMGEQVDHRVDIYAFGVMLWQALTGRRLRGTDAAAMHDILNRDVVDPRRFAPAAPEHLARIALKAVARDRDQRYVSAADMRAELEQWLENEGGRVSASDVGRFVTAQFENARRALRDTIEAQLASESADLVLLAQPTRTGSASAPVASRKTTAASRRRAPIVMAVAILVPLAALAGWIGLRRSGGGRAAPAPLVVLRAALPGPIAITDHPPPRAASQEALDAYSGALRALRDGDIGNAKAGFLRATELDPLFAAAHLRAAWWNNVSQPTASRTHFERATQLRASLAARDEALLHAFEPELYRETPDLAESERRLMDAIARFPGDAELLFYAARTQHHLGRAAEAIATFDAALAADPSFALAWWTRGEAQEAFGDRAGAVTSFDRCLEVSPGASSCLIERGWVHALQGSCDQLEADARQLVAVKPNGAAGHSMLARALVARGNPTAAEEAMKHAWAALPAAQGARRALYDRGQLAAVRGDFTEAIRLARELEALVAESTAELDQSEPAVQLLDAYEEIGDEKDAENVARSYLARRDAWSSAPAVGDSPAQGATPLMLAALRRGGELSANAFEQRRDAWASTAFAKLEPAARGEFWYVAFAAPVETRDDAQRALGALAVYPVSEHPWYLPAAGALMGVVLARAGRPADAARELASAVAACTALDVAVLHVRTYYELGRADEANGDGAGACAAYARVIERWGNAKPRSRTAEAATARLRALGCARP